MMSSEDRLKLNDALRRGVPVTRMVDYGMRDEDAKGVHASTAEGMEWVEALVSLAERDESAALQAETDGKTAAAAELWHSAAISLLCAQMAENFDTPMKRDLYRRMTLDFARFANNAELPIRKLALDFEGRQIFGWHFRGADEPKGAVVVFGGMSGWATAYRSMAEALCSRGLDCLLVDGRGQGETRLEGRLHLGGSVTAGFSRFLDHLETETQLSRFGIWGNSFGGLFAALTAVADRRIAACCINGAPPRCEVPPFRTPAEQMAAMFGRESLDGLEADMAALAFDPHRAPIPCPVLVLEGGVDPLATPGLQDIFLSSNTDPRSRKLRWEDGEHTLYNHAAERNRLVSDWFADCLSAPISPS